LRIRTESIFVEREGTQADNVNRFVSKRWRWGSERGTPMNAAQRLYKQYKKDLKHLQQTCQHVSSVRGCSNAIFNVSPTKPFFPNDLVSFNDRNGNRRNALFIDVLANAIADVLELVGPARGCETNKNQLGRHSGE
jgi:hypothetical protein